MSNGKKDWFLIGLMFFIAAMSSVFFAAWYRTEAIFRAQQLDSKTNLARLEIQKSSIDENSKRIDAGMIASMNGDDVTRKQIIATQGVLEANQRAIIVLQVKLQETQNLISRNQEASLVEQARSKRHDEASEKIMMALMINQNSQSGKQGEQTKLLQEILKTLKSMPTATTRTVYRDDGQAWVIQDGRWVPVPVYAEKR